MDLDEVLRELGDIQDRLNELPHDAFAERAELRERQEELRSAARRASDDMSDPDTVEGIAQQIRHLEHRRDQVLGNRLSPSAAAQTGMGGGIDPEYVHQMNRQLAEAADLEGIEAELSRLRARLRSITDGDSG